MALQYHQPFEALGVTQSLDVVAALDTQTGAVLMPSQPFPGILQRCFLMSLFNTHIVIKKNFLYSSGAPEKPESWRGLYVMLTRWLKSRGFLGRANQSPDPAGTSLMLENLWEAQAWDGFGCMRGTAGICQCCARRRRGGQCPWLWVRAVSSGGS